VSLRQIVHRMAGLAGVIGLPTVSARAHELDEMLADTASGGIDAAAIENGVEALRDAFAADDRTIRDLQPALVATYRAGRVLVVEDDPEQLRLVLAYLRSAGHEAVGVGSGLGAIDSIRLHAPSIVVLDIDLPEVDGFSICRQVKADAQLHRTSIVFVSARAAVADRLAGLTLGADDYLVKPVDRNELQLRLDRILRQREAARSSSVSPSVLPYDAFAHHVGSLLADIAGAVALVRAPRGRFDDVANTLSLNLRRRDLVGRYDDSHVVVWLPEFTGAAAAARLRELFQATPSTRDGVVIGVAASTALESHSLDTLLAAADEALAEARYTREPVAVHGASSRHVVRTASATVVIAEDDPDIARVIDAQLRGAGYQTLLSFDGRHALDTIRTAAPAAVILDLMMPGLSGFEVLSHLRATPGQRPRTIVVSARGREADVTRAFDLGADDYVMKPFSPPELLARLARLLR
jgi:DNA-binding response OmpR family regulator